MCACPDRVAQLDKYLLPTIVGLCVHVQPVLLDLINICYQLFQAILKTKSVTLPINTVVITNIYVKVWNRRSDLHQGNFLLFFTQPEITRKRPF